MKNNGNALNGTIGMVQYLKKEPKGDKIRCLFNLDYSDNNKNKLTLQMKFGMKLKKKLKQNAFILILKQKVIFLALDGFKQFMKNGMVFQLKF